MDYGFTHEGRVYTPSGSTVSAAENNDRNKAIEAAELEIWRTAPDRFVGYYRFADDVRFDSLSFHTGRTLQDCRVTTWLGTTIGTIIKANGYRHNFGGRFVSIRMIGTNGAEYYGRASWDGGTIIRLRRVR